ncbi:hypothetical protein ACPV5S_15635 [Vibrio astriarenae]
MRLIKCIVCLMFLHLSFYVSATDANKDGLDKAQDYVVKVVESCQEYGADSARKMMQSMTPEQLLQNMAIVEKYFNTQIKTCLQVSGFKLTEAANMIEIE